MSTQTWARTLFSRFSDEIGEDAPVGDGYMRRGGLPVKGMTWKSGFAAMFEAEPPDRHEICQANALQVSYV
jgi:hypothetical protein